MKTIFCHWKRIVLWGGVSLIYLVPFFTVPVFSDAYIKIPDIDGESLDKGHEQWIEVESIGMKVTVPITGGAGAGPRTAGTPEVSDFTIASFVSLASPQLFFKAVSGALIPDVTIEITTDTAAGPVVYYKVVMNDVFITSYNSSGTGDAGDVPIEEISFNYGKITWTYDQLDAAGSSTKTETSGWNVDAETPF